MSERERPEGIPEIITRPSNVGSMAQKITEIEDAIKVARLTAEVESLRKQFIRTLEDAETIRDLTAEVERLTQELNISEFNLKAARDTAEANRLEWVSAEAEVERLNKAFHESNVEALRVGLERSAEVERLKAENQRLQARVDNLAMLVRILVHSLRKVNTNSSSIVRAMDYLKRNGLTGSILRSDEPQPAEIQESGGHIESADCWCGPTVEEHPGGTLIIHNQTH